MASSHDIALPVGIHDGNIVGYRSVCDNLNVEVSLWNGTRLELEFRGVVFVQDFQSCGRPEEVEGNLQQFAEMDGSELLDDIRNNVGRQGAAQSYLDRLRHFRLADDAGEGSLDVICERLSIAWVDESGTRRDVTEN